MLLLLRIHLYSSSRKILNSAGHIMVTPYPIQAILYLTLSDKTVRTAFTRMTSSEDHNNRRSEGKSKSAESVLL